MYNAIMYKLTEGQPKLPKPQPNKKGRGQARKAPANNVPKRPNNTNHPTANQVPRRPNNTNHPMAKNNPPPSAPVLPNSGRPPVANKPILPPPAYAKVNNGGQHVSPSKMTNGIPPHSAPSKPSAALVSAQKPSGNLQHSIVVSQNSVPHTAVKDDIIREKIRLPAQAVQSRLSGIDRQSTYGGRSNKSYSKMKSENSTSSSGRRKKRSKSKPRKSRGLSSRICTGVCGKNTKGTITITSQIILAVSAFVIWKIMCGLRGYAGVSTGFWAVESDFVGWISLFVILAAVVGALSSDKYKNTVHRRLSTIFNNISIVLLLLGLTAILMCLIQFGSCVSAAPGRNNTRISPMLLYRNSRHIPICTMAVTGEKMAISETVSIAALVLFVVLACFMSAMLILSIVLQSNPLWKENQDELRMHSIMGHSFYKKQYSSSNRSAETNFKHKKRHKYHQWSDSSGDSSDSDPLRIGDSLRRKKRNSGGSVKSGEHEPLVISAEQHGSVDPNSAHAKETPNTGHVVAAAAVASAHLSSPVHQAEKQTVDRVLDDDDYLNDADHELTAQILAGNITLDSITDPRLRRLVEQNMERLDPREQERLMREMRGMRGMGDYDRYGEYNDMLGSHRYGALAGMGVAYGVGDSMGYEHGESWNNDGVHDADYDQNVEYGEEENFHLDNEEIEMDQFGNNEQESGYNFDSNYGYTEEMDMFGHDTYNNDYEEEEEDSDNRTNSRDDSNSDRDRDSVDMDLLNDEEGLDGGDFGGEL